MADSRVAVRGPFKRFRDIEQVLTLYDPDGLVLELVANRSATGKMPYVWEEGPVPIEHAIRGFHSVTLSEVGYEYTAHVLTKDLGFKFMGQDGSRFRFQISETKTVSRNKNGKQVYYGSDIVDLLCLPDARYGLWA